jgi:DNA-directed DNA polymerase III PolC
MGGEFVHLHVHSDMSALDGCARVEDYVQAAAKRGDGAIALTDHGTIRGAYLLTAQCNKHGVKPVYGVEFYVGKDMKQRGLEDAEKYEEETSGELFVVNPDFSGKRKRTREEIKKIEKEKGIRRVEHLTVWALDDEGLRNLYALSSKAWLEGFYYKPRIDLQFLCSMSKGLAVGTGCAGSVINGALIEKRSQDLDLAFSMLYDTFGENLYLEIMPHDLREARQQRVNQFALDCLALTGGKCKLLATQDAHYLREQDAAHHEVMLAIGTKATMATDDRFTFDGTQYFLKSAEEMRHGFSEYHHHIPEHLVEQSLRNTVELAERCSARIVIDPLKARLPHVSLPPPFLSSAEYLINLAGEGIRARGLDKLPSAQFDSYTARVARELKVLGKYGFVDYFLILYDVCRWAREHGIAKGPGRGSAAGSLISYLLGITDVDPIVFDLMFERFISPGRINMPDCDIDFSADRRGEIVEYLKEKYGEEKVALIGTLGRMNGKAVLRDVARVFDVPYQSVSIAASAIEPQDDRGAIEKALKDKDIFKKFAAENPSVVAHAVALEGLTKSFGVHAAGVVVAPEPIVNTCPIEVRNKGVVTAFDMEGIEGLGLIKIDVLSSRTVTVLSEAEQAIKQVSPAFALYGIPLDDPKTLEAFTGHDFVGVFQFDSSSAHRCSLGLTFKGFNDVVNLNAVNRPGAKDFATEYKLRQERPERTEEQLFHPKVGAITKETFGLLIFQEQVIKIATDVAGFSAEEADRLRKKIGKSEGAAAIEDFRKMFLDGCAKRTPDMSAHVGNELWDAIVKFGRYGFNKCIDISEKVATVEGEKEIGQLRAGDKIFGFLNGKPTTQKVIHIWPIEYRPTVRLEFDDGSTTVCTLGHRWQTERGICSTREIIEEGLCVLQDEVWAGTSRNEKSYRPSADVSGLLVDETKVRRMEDTLRPEFSSEVAKDRALKTLYGMPTSEVEYSSGELSQEVGRSCREGQDNRVGETNGEKNLFSTRHFGSSVAAPKRVADEKPGKNSRDRETAVGTNGDGRNKTEDGFSYGRKNLELVGSINLQEKCPNTDRNNGSASRFRWPFFNRGRWASPFPTFMGRRSFSDNSREGRCFRPLDQNKTKKIFGSFVDRLLFHIRKFAQSLGTSCASNTEGPAFRTYSYRRLVRWEDAGVRPVVDIEVGGDHLFTLANGLVSHNSHAVSYSLHSYWTMYLKCHWALEFYWALLANEPDLDQVRRYAKDAERHGVTVRFPDINKSSARFALDKDGECIVGSLLHIKGVGEAGAQSIVEERGKGGAYADLVDFLRRRGRAVTKRTVLVLAKSGALDSLLVNPKWVVENFEAFWTYVAKGKEEEFVKAFGARLHSAPQYSERERLTVAAEINPIAMLPHPLVDLEGFINEKVKVALFDVSEELFAETGTVYLAGAVKDFQERLVGDTTLAENIPGTEKEREHKGWDRKWLKVLLEGASGTTLWAKLDWNLYEEFRPVIDYGVPLLVCGDVSAEWHNVYINYLADIRKLMDDKSIKSYAEQLFLEHPATLREWNNRADKKLGRAGVVRLSDKRAKVIGVVARVSELFDKEGRAMGRFGLACNGEFLRVLCFASSWRELKPSIKNGALIKTILHGIDGGAWSLDKHEKVEAYE